METGMYGGVQDMFGKFAESIEASARRNKLITQK
jgi:hypothetical protein